MKSGVTGRVVDRSATLLADRKLHHERVTAILRSAAAVAFVVDLAAIRRNAGLHPHSLTIALCCYAITSAAILVWAFAVRRVTRHLLFAVHALDVFWPTLFCLLTGCAASPFLFLFLFAIIAAAYRRKATELLLIALAIDGIVLLEAFAATLAATTHFQLLSQSSDTASLEVRAAVLLILSGFLVCLAHWAHAEQQAHATQAILHQLRSDASVRKNLKEILPAIVELFEARRVVLVLRSAATGRALQWTAEKQGPQRLSCCSLPISDKLRCFAPMPPGSSSVMCTRERDGDRVIGLDQKGVPVPAVAKTYRSELLWSQPFRSLLAASLQFGSDWSGRLFVIDAPCFPEPKSWLRLLHHVATEAGSALYNFYLWRYTSTRVRASERQRLTRDLHDGVLQSLIATEMQMEVVRREAARHPSEAGSFKSLDLAQSVLRKEVGKLRSQIEELRSCTAPRQVLHHLEVALDIFQQETGIFAQFSCNVKESAIPRKLSAEIVRIVEEALSNVRKHSHARSVEVRLTAHRDAWEILIQDDGCGYGFTGQLSLSQMNAARKGPMVIRERVNSVNGDMTLESYPDRGSRLRIRFAATA
jgi:signal transduction histidine kinase